MKMSSKAPNQQSLRVVLALLSMLAMGCNGLGDFVDSVPTPEYPSGVIDSAGDYLTITTGESVYFTSKVYCPKDAIPCSFLWDFGDGQTSTVQDPGKHTYAKAGFYTAKFTVTDAKGKKDPTPSVAYVTAWSGQFSDDFKRTNVDWDKHGWRRPLLRPVDPMYTIKSGWLHITGDWGLPGSTAILAWPQVKDFHLEVTKRRHAKSSEEHYSDIILRMHPSSGIGQFYRVRIWEEGLPDSGLEIAIFKIVSPTDEHGYLLNDAAQPQSAKAINCKQCPYFENYPRTKDLRIIVEAQGATIKARIEDPKDPGTAVLTTSTTDTLGKPYLYEGMVGLTHFEGISDFDDITFKKLNSLVPDAGTSDSGTPDATAPDAGASD